MYIVGLLIGSFLPACHGVTGWGRVLQVVGGSALVLRSHRCLRLCGPDVRCNPPRDSAVDDIPAVLP